MKNNKMKKIGNIAVNVVLYAFLIICVLSVFLTISSKKDNDGAAELFGYQMRIVTTGSMEKSEHTNVSAYKIKDIPKGSMVFIESVPDDPAKADKWYSELKVGDVLTFRYVYETQVTITHRITSITKNATGGYRIELMGDNKSSEHGALTQVIEDTSVSESYNYVIGKVTGSSFALGKIMEFLKKPIGLVLVIMLPCAIIMACEIIKIVRMLSDEKKKKIKNDFDQKERELEELRQKISELEATKNEGEKEDEPPEREEGGNDRC